jgi:F-type H+-transporting ATPase subunit a
MDHAPTLFMAFSGVLPVVLQTLAVCVVFVLGAALLVRRELASGDALIPPEGPTLRNLLEVLLEAIVGLMRDTIGPSWPRYLPLVGTLGLFILVSNLMRQIPGFDGPTGYVEPNLSWAIMAFLVAEYTALREQGPLEYLKHMAGPAWYIWWITVPVEIVSHLARMLSLTVRLTGNMFADHTLIGVFLSFPIFVSLFTPWIFAGLGIFVAILQAFIFTFLTIIYIGQAQVDAHH